MTDAFEGQFPYYLLFGMTEEQYWEGDPHLVSSYRKAHKMRNEETDYQLWLQGFYNYVAFSSVLSNAFDKHSKAKYPDKPYSAEEDKKPTQSEDAIIKKLEAFRIKWESSHNEVTNNGGDNNS